MLGPNYPSKEYSPFLTLSTKKISRDSSSFNIHPPCSNYPQNYQGCKDGKERSANKGEAYHRVTYSLTMNIPLSITFPREDQHLCQSPLNRRNIPPPHHKDSRRRDSFPSSQRQDPSCRETATKRVEGKKIHP